MKFRSIRLKILFFSSLCLIVLGASIITYATLYVRNSVIRKAHDQISFIAQDRAKHVKLELSRAITSLNTLSIILNKVKNQLNPIALGRDEVDVLLQSVLKTNKNIIGAYTAWPPNGFDNNDDDYINEPGHDATGRFAPYWYRNTNGILEVEPLIHKDVGITDDNIHIHKKITKLLITDPQTHNINGESIYVVSLIRPISLKKEYLGFVGIDICCHLMQHLVQEAGIEKKKGRIIVISANRKIFSITNRPDMIGKDATKIHELIEMDVHKMATLKTFVTSSHGKFKFFAPVTFVDSNPWWIIVSLPRNEIISEATTLSKNLIFTGAGCIIVSIFILWFFSAHIVSSLNLLTQGVRQIERGNYGHLIEDVSSYDEIGELSSTFNNMSIEIKKKELERNKAEKALLEAYHIINRSPAIAFLWKNLGGWPVEFVSDNVKGLFGYTSDEFISNQVSYSKTVHPDDLERVAEEMSTFSNEKGRRNLTHDPYRIITKDGKSKWVDGRTFIRRDEKGKITHYQGVVLDITERKLFENALQESEEKYRLLSEECPISIMTFDIEGKVTFVNNWHLKTFARFKHDADFFVGKKIFELPGIIKAGVAAKLKKVLKGKHVILEDVHFPEFTGGHTGYQSIKAVPVYKEEDIVGGILIREDVTKRKHAEDALRESEGKYRSMMESMNDAVYICSPDFRVEYMNPAMIKRTGRDATGEYCFKALHDLEEKCPWCIHHEVQQGRNSEFDIISPKNNRSYHVSHSPIVHEDSSISKMTIFRDTTDFKKMETQLQQAQKMEAIGTLAGGIAHDFNNILFPISGYTEMLLQDMPDNNPFHKSLSEILAGAKRAGDLVTQILTFSRQRKHELKPLKVVLIVQEALKLIRSSLPTTIEIRQRVDKDCGWVMADPTQIHQIVMNLCANAFHAMEETGGKLTIALKEVELAAEDLKDPAMMPGPHVSLTVADTGPGMEQSTIDRIFDPYFTTKKEGKGTGLGLAVVHGIIKSHGGHISVSSEPGKGTEFNVYLPVIRTQTETAEEKTPLPIEKGNESVLLVDDREEIVSLGKSMLYKLGYHVTARTSSVEALETFRANPNIFDLVITDLTMPNMTGVKLAQKLMAIKPDIPVILCTGFSEKMSKENAEALGIKGFLLKPIVMKQLSSMIRKVLDDK